MKYLSCEEVRFCFDKTMVEDVLSLDEQRQVAMHLNHCSSCRRLFSLTSALPSLVENREAKFDAAIGSVMENIRLKREEKQTLKIGWFPPAMVAAVFLVMVGSWVFRDLFWTRPMPIPELPCVPSSSVETESGVLMTYCNSDTPKWDSDQREIRVTLDRGVAAFSVDPERPAKKSVVVETKLGEVRVKGTMFVVNVTDKNAWVQVMRGVVEVVPTDREGPAFLVKAGNGAELTRHETFTISKSVKDMVVQTLTTEPPDSLNDTSTEYVSEKPVSTDVAKNESMADTDTDNRGRTKLTRTEIRDRDRKSAHGYRTAHTTALIEEARTCLLDRDWKCAAAKYKEALRINSRRPGLTTVLISLAKIELRRLNRPQKALRHYEAYLQQAPTGPLVEEALLGMADSYRHLGLGNREEETLRRFIKRYPNSNMAEKARSRLKQMDMDTSL